MRKEMSATREVKARHRHPEQSSFMSQPSGGILAANVDWMKQNVSYDSNEGITSTYSLTEALNVK